MKEKYLNMIRRMKGGGRPDWNVYVLRCGDGTYYTGVAKDVEARLKKHRSGRGAAYTRTHLPVDLIYTETELTRSEALVREAELKRLPRTGKTALIGRRLRGMILLAADAPARPQPDARKN